MLRLLMIGVAMNLALSPLTLAGDRSSDRTPEELEKYKKTGEIENCLRLRSISSTKILDNRHILFKMRNGDVYLNKLPHRCGGLRFHDGFLYEVSGSSLCSVDIIRVLDVGGACGLGSFQKLEKREAPA